VVHRCRKSVVQRCCKLLVQYRMQNDKKVKRIVAQVFRQMLKQHAKDEYNLEYLNVVNAGRSIDSRHGFTLLAEGNNR